MEETVHLHGTYVILPCEALGALGSVEISPRGNKMSPMGDGCLVQISEENNGQKLHHLSSIT